MAGAKLEFQLAIYYEGLNGSLGLLFHLSLGGFAPGDLFAKFRGAEDELGDHVRDLAGDGVGAGDRAAEDRQQQHLLEESGDPADQGGDRDGTARGEQRFALVGGRRLGGCRTFGDRRAAASRRGRRDSDGCRTRWRRHDGP